MLPVRDISTLGSQRLSSIGYRVWPRLPAQYKQVVVFYRIKITIYYERTRYIILLISNYFKKTVISSPENYVFYFIDATST